MNNGNPNTLTIGLSPEWMAILRSWRNDYRQCTRCGIRYYEINNIGRWECFQHAYPAMHIDNQRYRQQVLTGSIDSAVWKCCGAGENDTWACVRADHTDKPRGLWYTEDANIPLLTKIQYLVEPILPNAIVDTWMDKTETRNPSIVNSLLKKEYVTIIRYDKQKQKQIVSKADSVINAFY